MAERLRTVQGTAGTLAGQIDAFFDALVTATAHVRAAQGEEERLPGLVDKLDGAGASRHSLLAQAHWVHRALGILVAKAEQVPTISP